MANPLYSKIAGTAKRYLVSGTNENISYYEYLKRNNPRNREMARVFMARVEDKYGIKYDERNVWKAPDFYLFKQGFKKGATKKQRNEALNYIRDYGNELDVSEEYDDDRYGWVGF